MSFNLKEALQRQLKQVDQTIALMKQLGHDTPHLHQSRQYLIDEIAKLEKEVV